MSGTLRTLRAFSFYLLLLFGFGMFSFQGWRDYQISPLKENGFSNDQTLCVFVFVTHIRKVTDLDFDDWTNLKILYPYEHSLSHMDHMYVHFLIGLPYYVLTGDPLNTYDFVLIFQFLIAMSGFFVLARLLTTNLFAIAIAGLYFVYLPAFIDHHPQINLYGFLPWFVYFVIQYYRTSKISYIYLSALCFAMQALVGVYHQLFMLTFTPLFLAAMLFYAIKKKWLKVLLNSLTLPHILFCLVVLGSVFYIVNRPYLQFHQSQQVVRSLFGLDRYAPDAVLSFVLPRKTGDVWRVLFSSPPPTALEGNLFIGVLGLLALSASWLLLIVRAKDFTLSKTGSTGPLQSGLKGNLNVLYLCLFLLFCMWLFSIGPYLHIFGIDTQRTSLYYYLYKAHDIFRSIRVTPRIIVYMSLPLAFLVLWWCDEIARHVSQRRIRLLLGGMLSLILIADVYKSRAPKADSSVFGPLYVYQTVAHAPGESLLELPSGFTCKNLKVVGECNIQRDAYYLFTHLYHDKWILNGVSTGYVPKHTLMKFARFERVYVDPRRLRKWFQEYFVSLVLIHKKRIDPASSNEFRILIENLRTFCDVGYEDENYLFLIRGVDRKAGRSVSGKPL